ncbi:MAG: hypothetical protein NC390_07605 [Fusobacterium sp.]|nr:hypothetical protein [Fusobacterium sp.]
MIALAIIGVVAAMTIPTFMANTAGAQFRTGFKKGITVLTQAASANYATEGYDFSGTNGFYGAKDNPTALYSTAGGATDKYNVIGFDTPSISGDDTYKDLHGDTPSLFHLFQNNLNMKNSHELTNYAVLPADAMLECTAATTGSAKIAGASSPVAVEDAPSDLTKRPVLSGLEDGAEVSNSKKIQGAGGLADLCGGRSLDNGGLNQGRMFQLEDGMVFTYDPAQAYCSESNPCYGYLDVNGPTGPNRVIACSQPVKGAVNKNFWIPTYGRNAKEGNLLVDCTVESKDITDIYPVLFYGSAVKPASVAAKSVLYSKKSNQATD